MSCIHSFPSADHQVTDSMNSVTVWQWHMSNTL